MGIQRLRQFVQPTSANGLHLRFIDGRLLGSHGNLTAVTAIPLRQTPPGIRGTRQGLPSIIPPTFRIDLRHITSGAAILGVLCLYRRRAHRLFQLGKKSNNITRPNDDNLFIALDICRAKIAPLVESNLTAAITVFRGTGS